MVTIGVLALQGAFIEHQQMLEKVGARTVQVRLPQHLHDLDGLVIPGGESTTIGKLAIAYGLIDPLRHFAQSKPTWGTCAGLIFLAKDIGIDSQPILGLMDVCVDRNAFGRQADSFEVDLPIKGLKGDTPFHAIFIRAPIVRAVSEGVETLAQIDDNTIVAVRQRHLLGTAFHPELTKDLRLHQYFYDMVAETDSSSP
ncbi:MAG: pyridoxal 5'-phosphate synthase glutaminase subunit PdxT [Anaerolineae bacterium]|nr:pyridoxal 5'-phosphate synthase glutaminase subunit PdxT [Anaerolineae bacterium]MDQ7035639.1 pyridoxal 5'-phosphate synthase glutaminase subunit PdxT [Anaerolineae bacterium]